MSGFGPTRTLLLLAVLAQGAPAQAYRPFDSTDADVVDVGEVEVELGPVGYLDEDGAESLVVPDVVVNVGLLPSWEMVLEGRGVVALDGDAEDRRYRLVDTGLFVKGRLRRGSLQEAEGPSVAVELGVLLPTLHDESGVGGEMLGIVSHRWPHVTAHLNGVLAYTRVDTWELGAGLILEGPERWGVRPVAEGTFLRELGDAWSASGLVGLIWEPRDDLSFDLGFRYGREAGVDVHEVRLGLTWSFDWGGMP